MLRRIFLLPAIALAGCSTANSWIHRPTNYEQIPQDYAKENQEGFEPDLAAVSVDASRRLIMSQKTPRISEWTSADRVTCPEPPPDAAVGILAKSALDLSRSAPGGSAAGAKFSDEFATSVTALAKRSASVEIWRTTSATYCTLLMNGWNTQADYYLASAVAFAITDEEPQTEKPPEPSAADKQNAAQASLDKASAAVIEADRAKAVSGELLAQSKALNDAKAIAAAQVVFNEASLRALHAASDKQKFQLEFEMAKRAAEAKKPGI